MMLANVKRVATPIAHPSCAKLHASESTPAPITAVIMRALAVHKVPSAYI